MRKAEANKTYPRRDPNRRPTHPGALLREDVIPFLVEEKGLTKTAIAEGLGMSRNQLYQILAEKQPVTPETAVKLAAAFGGSAKSWLDMQMACDLWDAEQTVDVGPAKKLRAA